MSILNNSGRNTPQHDVVEAWQNSIAEGAREKPMPRALLTALLVTLVAAVALIPGPGQLTSPRPAEADTFSPTDVEGLIAAINEANNNNQADVIDLGNGTFTLTAVDNHMSGPNGLPAIAVNDGTALNLVTIQNGTIERSSDSGTPDFRILNNGGHLILRNVTIRRGRISSGGGILNTTILEVRDGSVITGNVANQGAGIFSGAGAVTVVDSTVSENFADEAAGIYAVQFLDVINSTISGNVVRRSDRGGGISCEFCDLNLVNSTVSGNSTGVHVAFGGDARLINSTIVDNGVSEFGPGHGLLVTSSGAAATLRNTLLVNNREAPAFVRNCTVTFGTITSGGHNLSDDDTCNFTGQGDQDNVTDAGDFIGDLDNNGGLTETHALLPDSTAIDAADDDICTSPPVGGVDQRGVARPQPFPDGRCDIGAFELAADVTPPVIDVPDDIEVEATGPGGAIVAYEVSAEDDVDGEVPVDCEPASDSLFPIGTTTVTCSARDSTGNEATASFTVTVLGSAALFDTLEELILEMSLPNPTEKSLLNKVNNARKSLENGRTDAACSQLADFLNQVADFESAGKLTAEQADALITDATRIRTVIDCQ